MDMDPGKAMGKRPRLQPMDGPNDCNVLGFDGFFLQHESDWILERGLSACPQNKFSKASPGCSHLYAAGGTAGSKPAGTSQIQNVEDDSVLLQFSQMQQFWLSSFCLFMFAISETRRLSLSACSWESVRWTTFKTFRGGRLESVEFTDFAQVTPPSKLSGRSHPHGFWKYLTSASAC